MALIVQKFGGTSVGTVERIEQVADKVKKFRDAGDDLVVVLSAMSGETNRLIALAKQISGDDQPVPRELDVIVSTGEQVTIALLAIALGSGFFKGSVAARLSGLYVADDPRRVEGFRLFYIAINIAGLVAPLTIGTLGEEVHWHAGFALSCAAMVAGLALYVARLGGVSGGGLEHDEVPAPAAAALRRSEWPVLAALGAATALLAWQFPEASAAAFITASWLALSKASKAFLLAMTWRFSSNVPGAAPRPRPRRM